MLLIECAFMHENKKRQFRFEGTVINADPLEFEDIQIYEILEGKAEKFAIVAITWAGEKLTEEDAIADVISRYTCNETGFEALAVCDEIESLVADSKKKGTITISNREVPKCIRYGWLIEEYTLDIATNVYLYYVCADKLLMCNTDTGEVLSVNVFAENAYWDTVDAVISGEEELIYGKLYDYNGDVIMEKE